MAGFRVKDTSRSLCYPVYVVIVFHLVKQSAKPLGFLFFLIFFTIMFSFSLTWDHMGEKIKMTSPLKMHMSNILLLHLLPKIHV